jgi:hypothetical protein
MPKFAAQSVPTSISLIWKQRQQGMAIFGDTENDKLELLKALSVEVIGAPDSKNDDYAGYVVVYRAYDMAKTWCTLAISSTGIQVKIGLGSLYILLRIE